MFEGIDRDGKFDIMNCGRELRPLLDELTGQTVVPPWFVTMQVEFVIEGFDQVVNLW